MKKHGYHAIALVLCFIVAVSSWPIFADEEVRATAAYTADPYYSLCSHADGIYDDVNNLKARSNCYGYAFRLYCSSVYGSTYKQQPGEFANKSGGLTINYPKDGVSSYVTLYDNGDLYNFYKSIIFSPTLNGMTNAERIACFYSLMSADAAAMGYTVTRYYGTPADFAQNNPNSRLVGFVVDYYEDDEGTYDGVYHFYMRHSDGSWSHKLGTKNQHRDVCLDHYSKLTDSNIISHMAEGDYHTGSVAFFKITKSAVIDYPHNYGANDAANSTCVQTTLEVSDHAGNIKTMAQSLGTVPYTYSQGKINYGYDVDYYAVKTPSYTSTRTYKFVVSPTTSVNTSFAVTLYNTNGAVLYAGSSASGGACTITYSCTGSTDYLIAVSAPNSTAFAYGIPYTLAITQQS